MATYAIWIIAALTIAGVLVRPRDLPEWLFASVGAFAVVVTQLLPLPSALHAIGEGTDVYFFLVGMMLLSELSREEGLFDWLASFTARHADGSPKKLFALLYGAGILVTVFLSNDATAVVLTPAVYASVKRAGAKPVPYLFACALIANAASFVLPISNPANLVVYNSHLPQVFTWLSRFALPSVASIAVTFLILLLWFNSTLKGKLKRHDSQSDKKLGLPALLASAVAVIVISIHGKKWPKEIFKNVSWGVIPLVAGLFVIVEAVNQAGALSFARELLARASSLDLWQAKLASGFTVGIVSNIANNLPVGLVAGLALHGQQVSQGIRDSLLVGVDLGPNLSVTGSLATILWLMAIRREGEKGVSSWDFFKLGLFVMPAALAAALLCLH